MKLDEFKHDDLEWSLGRGAIGFIKDRLAALGAKEHAALVVDGDDENPVIVVATDLGVAICKREIQQRQDRYELAITPWSEVSTPWIVYAGYASAPNDHVTLQIDRPLVHASSSSTEEPDAITSFYIAALSEWRRSR